MTNNRIKKETALHVRLDILVCLFLMIVTLALYWQVRNHEFVNYDDSIYVTENVKVQSGINAASIKWALTDTQSTNWHPLTWLSHMLDVELYGMDAGRHHLTNLLFHIANTLLLFLVLRKMTGNIGPSSFVAAVFALHPLNVESVAWVAERKNVLSTFFWMLTMGSYVWYAEHRRKKMYLFVFLFFGLGLMAKPMLVTLPFVLLLLDFWPLRRWKAERFENVTGQLPPQPTIMRLILEKIPLLVLTLASCVITLRIGQVYSFDLFPLHGRFANVLLSYMGYIQKMIWPANLACFYPYPDLFPAWKIIGTGLVLVSISLLAVKNAFRRPYFFVGWWWYIGTLVPVIGLVQVGPQAMADRYAYIPLIGLLILIAWGVPDILSGYKYKSVFLIMSSGIILSALMICSWLQISHWQNSTNLFKHAIATTDNNWLAHTNLGRAFYDQGQLEAAIDQYHKALVIKPNTIEALFNLAKALSDSGKIDQAAMFYQKTLKIVPDYAGAHNNLGNILAFKGDFESAVRHYHEVLRIKPEDIDAYNNLANVLAAQGKFDKAARLYIKVLGIRPAYTNAHYNFGNLLAKMDPATFNQAANYFFEMAGNRREYAPALYRIGTVMARQGQISKANVFFTKAIQINPAYAPARQDAEKVSNGLSSGER